MLKTHCSWALATLLLASGHVAGTPFETLLRQCCFWPHAVRRVMSWRTAVSQAQSSSRCNCGLASRHQLLAPCELCQAVSFGFKANHLILVHSRAPFDRVSDTQHALLCRLAQSVRHHHCFCPSPRRGPSAFRRPVLRRADASAARRRSLSPAPPLPSHGPPTQATSAPSRSATHAAAASR